MGRKPCCEKVGLKRGPWTTEEDKKLVNFILTNGQCCWRAVPKLAGLLRCGKSCRLRWINYLRPDVKRGLLSEYEEKMVIDLHAQLGNRWSKIASHLSGRTDNEIKNHWNTHIKKKLIKSGIDPGTHKPLSCAEKQEEKSRTLQSSQKVQRTQTDGEKLRNEQEENSNKEQNLNVDELMMMNTSEDFCTDEIPLIDPFDILVPNNSSASSCSSSSSSCVLTSDHEPSKFLENLQISDLERILCGDEYENNNNDDMSLWDYHHHHQDLSGWDLLISDDDWNEFPTMLL